MFHAIKLLTCNAQSYYNFSFFLLLKLFIVETVCNFFAITLANLKISRANK